MEQKAVQTGFKQGDIVYIKVKDHFKEYEIYNAIKGEVKTIYDHDKTGQKIKGKTILVERGWKNIIGFEIKNGEASKSLPLGNPRPLINQASQVDSDITLDDAIVNKEILTQGYNWYMPKKGANAQNLVINGFLWGISTLIDSDDKGEPVYNSLRKIPDSFKKIIIVNGAQKDTKNDEAFVIMGLKHFLLNPEGLEFEFSL